MFGKIASLGAVLALLLSVGAVRAADPKPQPSCCATKTRCCTQAKYCCDQPEKALCCKTGTACCDMKDCCGPKPTVKGAGACPVTGRDRRQCCASKASPMPPCCMKGCDTAGQHLR